MMTLDVLITVTSKDKPYLRNCLVSIEKAASQINWQLNFIIISNETDVPAVNYLHYPVKIIKNKTNIGLSSSVNKAVDHVKNSWFILVSPDVITHKYCLENIFPDDIDKNTALIGPKVLHKDGSLQHTILPETTLLQIFLEQSFLYKLFPQLSKHPLADSSLYRYTHQVNGLMAIWWLMNKNAFIKTGGFDRRFFLYFEDADFCRRLISLGFKVIYNSDSSITHLLHKSTGGETNGKLFFASFKKYLSKNFNPFSANIAILTFLSGSALRLLYWQIILFLPVTIGIKSKARYKIRYFNEIIRSL